MAVSLLQSYLKFHGDYPWGLPRWQPSVGSSSLWLQQAASPTPRRARRGQGEGRPSPGAPVGSGDPRVPRQEQATQQATRQGREPPQDSDSVLPTTWMLHSFTPLWRGRGHLESRGAREATGTGSTPQLRRSEAGKLEKPFRQGLCLEPRRSKVEPP
jgi:hypothetical protein